MKITEIETFTVGAGWKNWLFVKVHTDAGIHGIGEGTLNGFIAHHRSRRARAEASRDRPGPARISSLVEAHARQRLARWRAHPPHRDRGGRGRLLGHSGQEPRRADPPAARRPRARQRAGLRQWLVPHRAHAGGLPRGGEGRARQGLQGVQARSVRHRAGLHLARGTRAHATTSAACCATSCPATRAS